MKSGESWIRLDENRKHPSRRVWAVSVCLTVFIISGVCMWVLYSASREWQWGSVWKYRQVFAEGWIRTVGLSLACLIGSMLVGSLLACGQLSRLIPLRALATVLVEFIRGTPLLVQIMFFFYVVADGLELDNRYAVGILTLSLYSGTYISEILRGGIEASGRSQLMSALASGMSHRQAYRYIIIPQAIRAVVPALAGQLVALIKHSSLLSVIAVEEFTHAARSVNSITYSTLESYLPLLVGYIILTLPVSWAAGFLERRFRFDT